MGLWDFFFSWLDLICIGVPLFDPRFLRWSFAFCFFVSQFEFYFDTGCFILSFFTPLFLIVPCGVGKCLSRVLSLISLGYLGSLLFH